MVLGNLTLEEWRTIFLGLQTAVVAFASFVVTLLNLANPKYSKGSNIEYLSREKTSVFYKKRSGTMPVTEIGFCIRNTGIGIGKINKLEIVNVEGTHIDANSDNFGEPKSIDSHRLFPLQKANFEVTTDLNKSEFNSIEVLIHDKKLGKTRVELDCEHEN